MDAVPTEEERVAVDTLLGPAETGWEGGAWRDEDGRVAGGGRAARARRHLLLPALHAVNDAAGWISEGALNYICERLTIPPAEAFGVAGFYALFATSPRPRHMVYVCDDVACRGAGAEALCAELAAAYGPEDGHEGDVGWERSPCLGHCAQGPAVFVRTAGEGAVEIPGATTDRIARVLQGTEIPAPDPTAVAAGEAVLTSRIGVADPEDIDDYETHGGYRALQRAVAAGPEAVVVAISDSGLVGRGGAGFPAGVKWAAVAAAGAPVKYVVCNADESEPGTFKDRVLLEEDPFAVVEAITIAGFATNADHGVIYLRGEYERARRRLREALEQARERGYLGADILGSDFTFDIEIRRGAGAYICGEETALFESIEGRRGEPRSKPPFPTEAGLLGRPTLVNNVETLVNVLPILIDGAASFAARGTERSRGTKLFAVSGRVAAPGVYEVPFGITLGALLDLAGGVTGDLRTVLLGGAAGTFVGPDALDLPLTLEDAAAAGTTLGSGAVTVFDSTDDLPAVVKRIAAFFRDEACGQCVPCRIGTVRQEEALHRYLAGGGESDRSLLVDIGRAMEDASICGLGQTAAGAVRSAIEQGLVPGGGGR
jgi:NADH-quinone oxidoreductase subunit F